MRRKPVSERDIVPKEFAQLRCREIDDSVSCADRYRQHSALAKDPFRCAANHPDKERRPVRRIAAEMSIHDRRVGIRYGKGRNEARGDRGRDGKDHAIGAIEREGMTVVPLKIYFNEKGRAKVEIALAKGKKLHDKRDTERQRDAEREMARVGRTR